MSWLRLFQLYRRAGNSSGASLRLTVSLLWRNHLNAGRRYLTDRRAEVERAARQRL